MNRKFKAKEDVTTKLFTNSEDEFTCFKQGEIYYEAYSIPEHPLVLINELKFPQNVDPETFIEV